MHSAATQPAPPTYVGGCAIKSDLLESHGYDFEIMAPPDDEEQDLEPSVDVNGDKINFVNQRCLLMGDSLYQLDYFNWFSDVPQEDETKIMQQCTQLQQTQMNEVATHSPCGLLIMEGPPGTRKTIALVHLLLLQFAAGQKVSAHALANGATTNLAQRLISAAEKLYPGKHLIIRMWSDTLESRIIDRCDPATIASIITGSTKSRRQVKYDFHISLAAAVCQIGGLYPTSNPEIINLRDSLEFKPLVDVMQVPIADRGPEQKRTLKHFVHNAIQVIWRLAYAVLSTTTMAGCRWVQQYANLAEICAIDEAAAATEIEWLIPWRGSKPLALVGGQAQLPPFVASEGVKYENGYAATTSTCRVASRY